MNTSSEQGWARVVGVLRRRRLPIAAVAAAVLAVGALVVARLPSAYRASAVVRAVEAQPAKEYVAPTMMEPVGERLKTERLQVMARPILVATAQALDLPAKLHQPLDEVVDDMRARMEVKVEGEDTFLLSYEDRDPERARAVVDAVAARFMADQLQRRQEVAKATVAAIQGELTALRPQLDALEDKVRDFKLSHYGALPEQQESNLRALDQATMEVDIQSTNLDLENERRRQLLAAAMSPLRHQEDILETALHDAKTRYTPDHPEVKRIAAELQALHDQRLSDENELRGAMHKHNPELLALDGEIRKTESLIAGLRQRQADVRKRVDETAKNAQALARLSTDFEVVKTRYQAALGRLHEAELASGLEQGLRPYRYRLVEGAATPRIAVRPNRPLWALGVLAAAVALALALGFALDRRDRRIHEVVEAEALAPSGKVLACIPDLDADSEEA